MRAAVLQAPEIGTRFERGVVIDNGLYLYAGRQHPGHPGERGCRLQCDCGNVYDATLTKLVGTQAGHTRSCGCLARELLSTSAGLSKHPLYKTWENMLARCENPAHISYRNYGGRDIPIEVCDAWHDPAVFIADIEATIGPRPEGMTLDRWPDNNGPYAPGKVRWATKSEQGRNRRPPTDAHRANIGAGLRNNPAIQGSNNSHAKLTDDIVIECRERHYIGGEFQNALAREFSVTQAAMNNAIAITGKTWRHVPFPENIYRKLEGAKT